MCWQPGVKHPSAFAWVSRTFQCFGTVVKRESLLSNYLSRGTLGCEAQNNGRNVWLVKYACWTLSALLLETAMLKRCRLESFNKRIREVHRYICFSRVFDGWIWGIVTKDVCTLADATISEYFLVSAPDPKALWSTGAHKGVSMLHTNCLSSYRNSIRKLLLQHLTDVGICGVFLQLYNWIVWILTHQKYVCRDKNGPMICPTNSPKHRNTSFTVMKDKEKQKIRTVSPTRQPLPAAFTSAIDANSPAFRRSWTTPHSLRAHPGVCILPCVDVCM